MAKQALHDRIDHDYTNHRPTDEAIEVIERVRAGYKELAHNVIDACPEGRELSLALTHLNDSLFESVAAIARSNPAT